MTIAEINLGQVGDGYLLILLGCAFALLTSLWRRIMLPRAQRQAATDKSRKGFMASQYAEYLDGLLYRIFSLGFGGLIALIGAWAVLLGLFGRR